MNVEQLSGPSLEISKRRCNGEFMWDNHTLFSIKLNHNKQYKVTWTWTVAILILFRCQYFILKTLVIKSFSSLHILTSCCTTLLTSLAFLHLHLPSYFSCTFVFHPLFRRLLLSCCHRSTDPSWRTSELPHEHYRSEYDGILTLLFISWGLN